MLDHTHVLILLVSSYYYTCVLILFPPLVYDRYSCGAQLAFPSIRRTVLLKCRCVEWFYCICGRIPLHMCPDTTTYVSSSYTYVLTLTAGTCVSATRYVSSIYVSLLYVSTICVLILLHVSLRLDMFPHTTTCFLCPHATSTYHTLLVHTCLFY